MDFFYNIEKKLLKEKIYFCATDTPVSPDCLHRKELLHIKNANEKRQKEYATVRQCAKKLLSALNIKTDYILSDDNNAPVWPDGICGSLSHSNTAYCAVIAKKENYNSIGIDIEDRSRKISPGAVKFFVNPDEEKFINRIDDNFDLIIKIIFSAKESIFKLIYPLIKKKFYFKDVSVFPDLANHSFTYKINNNLSEYFIKDKTLTGKFFFNNKWLITITVI